ncbi:MAG: GNAT family N-acetyltransferase [Promethearchaeota archaeon]
MTPVKPVFEKIELDFGFKDYIFHSGIDELDEFFYEYSGKFIKYGYSQIYILRNPETLDIMGFFSLSSSTIRWEESLGIEKITRYVPGILLGMFAIDDRYRRKKYGSDLIKKVINIALKFSKEVGCRCVFVDSLIKLETINFYLNMGFKFVDIPLGETILKKLGNNEKLERKTIKMYFDLYKIQK